MRFMTFTQNKREAYMKKFIAQRLNKKECMMWSEEEQEMRRVNSDDIIQTISKNESCHVF